MVTVALPLETVTLFKVRLPTEVVVDPKVTVVLPSVAVLLARKLLGKVTATLVTLALFNVKFPMAVVVLLAAIEVLPTVIGKPVDALAACEIQVVPFDVSTLPLEPGATTWTGFAALPKMTLFKVIVVKPVPPCPAVIGAERLEIVAFVSVRLPTDVVVDPSVTVVFPRVAVLFAKNEFGNAVATDPIVAF